MEMVSLRVTGLQNLVTDHVEHMLEIWPPVDKTKIMLLPAQVRRSSSQVDSKRTTRQAKTMVPLSRSDSTSVEDEILSSQETTTSRKGWRNRESTRRGSKKSAYTTRPLGTILLAEPDRANFTSLPLP